MGLLQIGSAGGLVVSLTLVVVSLATPGWIYITQTSTPPGSIKNNAIAFGLFYSEPQLNDYNGTNKYATEIYFGSMTVSICVCFLCIGLGFMTVGAIANTLSEKFKNENMLKKAGGILGITSGLFMAAGMATFTGLTMTSPFYNDFVSPSSSGSPEYAWGYSFYLAWAGVGVGLISGIVGVCGKSDGSVYPA